MTMTDWENYAHVQPINQDTLAEEPVQLMRLRTVARRARGTVLDVGAADGYGAWLIARCGHPVDVLDVSATRVERAEQAYGLAGHVGNAEALPFDDDSYDTVILGEIMEHLDNPGESLAEACRVARQRVVVSLPLNGWADPTHQWRISLDVLEDPTCLDATKTQQIVLTFHKAECWPPDYADTDEDWHHQFREGD